MSWSLLMHISCPAHLFFGTNFSQLIFHWAKYAHSTVMLFVRKPVRISKLAQFNFFVEFFWIFYWNILFQVIKKICHTWPHFQAKFCSILFKLSNQCKYEIIRSQIKQRCATMFIFLQRPKPVINRFYTAYLKISQYVT